MLVSRLGLGGLFIARTATTPDEARRLVHRALELGINYIDTAPTYGDSEDVLGQALQGAPGPYFLASKLGGRPLPFDAKNKYALQRSLEDTFHKLRRSYLDVLLIHEPDRPGQYDWWKDGTLDGPVNEFLADLKLQGKIHCSGLGGTTAYELAPIIATGKHEVVLTAFNYSLLWREAAIAVLPEAKRQGTGVIAGSPLQQGALARRYDDAVASGAPWLSAPRREQFKRLYALVDEAGIALPELALRFVLSNPDIHMVLTGARSVAELEANVAAAEKGSLSADLLHAIDAIAALVPFRPFEEPFVLPFERAYKGPGRAR